MEQPKKHRMKISKDIDNLTDGFEHLMRLRSFVEKHKDKYTENTFKGLEMAIFKVQTDLDILWDFYGLFTRIIEVNKKKQNKPKDFNILTKINFPKFEKNGTIILDQKEIKINLVDLFPLEKNIKDYEDTW